ncbi:MAG: helix-turn-helix domain-containing protein [Pseudomonadota bacterium]
MERGVPVRAISRGFAVLSAVSRDGPITLMGISRSADVPYATACRVVQTLMHEGLIEREVGRKKYRVTSLVQSLATGFQQEDLLAAEARPHLEELCKDVGWPISLATRVGTRMMVRESTHKMTSLTFTNYYPGFTLPISECATGKAYLAHCAESERDMIKDALEATDSESSQTGLLLLSDGVALKNIKDAGYALQARNQHNFEPGKTSSLAVPVFDENRQLVGCMALIFFASAIKPNEAATEFLPKMQETAKKISTSLGVNGFE